MDRLELACDLETYSATDIASGVHKYVEDRDFTVLLCAYKFSDEDEVQLIDFTEDDLDTQRLEHIRFFDALTDPSVIKTAWNASWERTCLRQFLSEEMPAEQWRDTMVLAVSIGLPRALKDAGPALGLAEDQLKLKTGKALIDYFCKPCRPTKSNGGRTRNYPHNSPERWKLFCEYNVQDVVTEQAILSKIRQYRPDVGKDGGWREQHLWTVDQRINDRGVLLDTDLAKKIVDFDAERSERLKEEACRISGLSNPNSVLQLLPWLIGRGVKRQTLTKVDVAELLKSEIPDDVRRVLEIRKSLSMTSVKKYGTMLDIACADSRARGILAFYGGRTGRWAGRSLQPQNLARNTMDDDMLDLARDLIKSGHIEDLEIFFDDVSDTLSQLVRTGFIPSPGRKFVVSDFSAIEARVIAWVASENWRTELFRNGGDIYCESASRIYHVPVVKHGVNGDLRQRGKVAELACGYQGGVGAMKRMDTSGSVPEEEMADIVRQWRAESPNIVKFWKALESAALAVVSGRVKEKTLRNFQNICFYLGEANGTKILFMRLPSGRSIAYWDPRVENDSEGHQKVSYAGQNQVTRKIERIDMYGGRWAENAVQSIARDCLAEKMMLLEDEFGYEVVFHVHDEMIFDVPVENTDAEKIVDKVMGLDIDWAPGLPLKGGTYSCDFYRKD